jgi:hypothetical protein
MIIAVLVCLFGFFDLSLSQCDTKVTSNGFQYDLSSIQTVSGTDPDKTSGWVYTVNPCKALPMTCDVCQQSASYCQQSRDQRFTFCIGTLASATYNGASDGKSLTITFAAPQTGDPPVVREGKLIITCDPAAATPQKVDIHDPVDVKSYAIRYNSAAACGTSAMSGGTIFLIIFFSAIALYFLVGIAVMAGVKGQRGKEMVPNLEFWVSVPGLIQDGATFTIGKIKGLAGGGSA